MHEDDSTRPSREPRADAARCSPTEVDARNLLDQLPAIVYVADRGIEGRWRYVSAGVQSILGFSAQEWIDDPGLWARQVHPDDRLRIFEHEDELAHPEVPDEYRMMRRDGTTVWVRDEAALVTDVQGLVHWHGVLSDITDHKLAEVELERRADQQAAVARLGQHALEGAGFERLMDEALREATRILAVEMGAILQHAGTGDASILRAGVGLPRPFESASVRSELVRLDPRRGAWLARKSTAGRRVGSSNPHVPGQPAVVTGQIEGRQGSWGTLWLSSSDERSFGQGDLDFVQALANILADAIQRRSSEDDIRYQALHDPLTNLPNRALFLDCLASALARPGAQVAVVLLDIDNFKLVNDSLGHSAGDELLKKIAPRLQRALRPGDTIARLGGDEFVVLLERIPDERAAALIAERIVTAFEVPFGLSVGEHFAKASLGIVVAQGQGSDPAGLISDADAAMYQAKERGRARFEIFDGAMRARVVERLSLENDLRRALEHDQLHIVYQPIVSLRDGSIISVEALLRWQHPTRGPVGPEEFVPIAEESGLIEPIGRWVLDTACAQAVRWHAAHPDRPPLGICVNLSIRQFSQHDLEAAVTAVLDRTRIEPSSLRLELTESVLLQEADRVHDTITRLASHGVRFLLDDFGTGYSSLAYLTRLPIDGLKVDRSFVQALGSDWRSTAITTAIVRMAQALAVEVIAEGVETERQAEALRALDCRLAQGFHFHRPLTPLAVSELLSHPQSRRLISPQTTTAGLDAAGVRLSHADGQSTVS